MKGGKEVLVVDFDGEPKPNLTSPTHVCSFFVSRIIANFFDPKTANDGPAMH